MPLTLSVGQRVAAVPLLQWGTHLDTVPPFSAHVHVRWTSATPECAVATSASLDDWLAGSGSLVGGSIAIGGGGCGGLRGGGAGGLGGGGAIPSATDPQLITGSSENLFAWSRFGSGSGGGVSVDDDEEDAHLRGLVDDVGAAAGGASGSTGSGGGMGAEGSAYVGSSAILAAATPAGGDTCTVTFTVGNLQLQPSFSSGHMLRTAVVALTEGATQLTTEWEACAQESRVLVERYGWLPTAGVRPFVLVLEQCRCQGLSVVVVDDRVGNVGQQVFQVCVCWGVRVL